MVTPVYAALLALVFVFLSLRTLMLRRITKITVGTDNNVTLTRAVRAHANFVEYTPLAIILIYMLEAQQHNVFLIHALCIALLLGRAIHAFGISQTQENIRYRVVGMALTLACIISASIRILLNVV